MPRTKAGRSRATGVESLAPLPAPVVQRILKTFDVRVNYQREQLLDDFKKQRELLNELYQSIFTKYAQDLDKTMGELRNESFKENIPSDVPNTFLATDSGSKTSTSSRKDDGYVTDGSSVQSKPIRQSRRISRSLSRNNIKSGTSSVMGPPGKGNIRQNRSSSVGNMGPPRSAKQRYHTPVNRSRNTHQYPPITPKVAPNTPLTLLRRPRQGEMVVSLHGSPLLVNSITGVDEKANCNIPLADGTILSLLPNKMTSSTASLPFDQMNPETRQELKMLQANLSAFLKSKNK